MKKLFPSIILMLLFIGCNIQEGNGPIQTIELEQVLPATTVPTTTNEPEVVEEATAVPPTPLSSPTPANQADADVLSVSATETAVGLWTFSVEVTHPDTGWEDYTDGWDVVLPDGTVAKANPNDPFTRLLLHPHENEQPFTRSQSNVPIPPEVTTVTVRAHDLVDGFGGQEVVVDLTAVSGEKFEVNRLNP
ncbi:hypothetical protein [Candidatus Leptofilum sp.]|uniref:hypothetical protein n=1 Tax=Candidatus Leptofilum sp. TaxID=3241576 RepID=UPI003B5BA866